MFCAISGIADWQLVVIFCCQNSAAVPLTSTHTWECMSVTYWLMLFLAVAAALLCEVVPWLCAPWSASFTARCGTASYGRHTYPSPHGHIAIIHTCPSPHGYIAIIHTYPSPHGHIAIIHARVHTVTLLLYMPESTRLHCYYTYPSPHGHIAIIQAAHCNIMHVGWKWNLPLKITKWY